MKKSLLSLAILATLSACATHDGVQNKSAHAHAATASSAPAPEKKIVMVGHSQDVMLFVRAFDANKDDVLTRAENENHRRARFNDMDTDKNGWVSLPEYVAEFHKYLAQGLKEEMPRQDQMTEVRFVSLAGKDGTHITREQFDKSGEKAFAAFAAGKLPEDLKDRSSAGMLGMPTNHTVKGMMALYDRNGDGELPREEYDAVRDEQFKNADVNRDNKLSRDEYAAEFQQRLDHRIHEMTVRQIRQTRVRFGILDTNKNDRLDWEEFKFSADRQFDFMDRNKDGRVDAEDAKLPVPTRENANTTTSNNEANKAKK